VEVHKRNPEIRKILLTGQASADAVGKAVNLAKLYRYISKPWEENDLRVTVQEAAKSYRLNKQLESQVKILSALNVNSKALSEEVKPRALTEKLLHALLKDSEVSHGAVIFVDEKTGAPNVEATQENGTITTAIIEYEDLEKRVPMALIRHVANTRDFVVLNNACRAGDWMENPYIQEKTVRSVFCCPIQKIDNLIAVLYLEHFTEVRFFGTEKIDYLQLMVAQAAISLDNALLYDSLEQKVNERTFELAQKNKDITDSIKYAERIQQALLTSSDLLSQSLPESFIFYKPKDILSGDFYWFTRHAGFFFLCMADCTGHGVPGALMSVLGSNLIHQIVRESGMLETNQILDELHSRIRLALTDVNDGMDVSICRIDIENHIVQLSSANRPVYFFRGQDMFEFMPDKMAIGGTDPGQRHPYNVQTFKLQAGDTFYMFSDGFTDQFGGEQQRKYSTKRFQEFLGTLQGQPMPQQRNSFETQLHEWSGGLPQTDDIAIVGIRLP